MKLEVHTLRFGNPLWLGRCAATLEAWCERHKLDLFVWNEDTATLRGYPNVKFCEIDMLESFLRSGADRFLYVDADVIVNPNAPILDFPETGFHAATDEWHMTHDAPWRDWCHENFGVRPEGDYVYRNAGVWSCDRAAAEKFLAEAKPPFIERLMEEFQWNWWLYNAVRNGMEFRVLPDAWNHSNRITERPDPTWFLHVWGDNKEEELAAIP